MTWVTAWLRPARPSVFVHPVRVIAPRVVAPGGRGPTGRAADGDARLAAGRERRSGTGRVQTWPAEPSRFGQMHPRSHQRLAGLVVCVAGSLLLALASACTSTTSSSGSPGPVLTAVASPSGTTASSTPTDTERSEGSTSSTDGSSGDESAACELLTQRDAADAFGEAAIAGDQRQDECWWSTANDLKTVNVIRRTDDLDTWRSGYQNAQWEPIELGDEGYAGKALDSITFRVGDTTYEINVVYSTSGDPRQVVNDLAAKVAARV